MPQVKRLGVAGSKAWRRRSVFLPGTCDTNQSYVPSSVAGLPSFFRPATINNQTCDICQRDFLANLLPSVEDGRCGRGPARRMGGGLRSGTPLRGYPSHCASLAGPSRSRSHGRLRRPQSSRRSAPRCETAKAGKVSFQRRHLARGKLLEGRRSHVNGQGPRHIIRPCPYFCPLPWSGVT